MDNDGIAHKELRRERERRGLSQEDVAEKIGTTAKIVGRWERGESMPRPYYRQKLIELFEKSAEELGLTKQEVSGEVLGPPLEETLSAQDAASNELSTSQNIQMVIPQSVVQSSTIHIIVSSSPINTKVLNPLYESKVTSVLVDGDAQHGAYFQQVVLSQPVTAELGKTVDRREFFQEGLRTGAAILTSYDLINNELLDRFLRALKKPSTIDERTLNYFERRTEGYWQDRHSAALVSSDLLSYVIEHLQKVIALLEGPLFPSVRTRLCCIVSGIAQLAGHLLFDMGEFTQARNFHRIALTAAQEGNNQALEAVAWGRMSFTWTYSGNALEALRCIQEARRLAAGSVNLTVRAYLAAVEAEIQAILGHGESCLKALDAAAGVEDCQDPKEEMYWLHFDRSRLAGYQGTCFRRLYNPEDPCSHSFLDEARQALTGALAVLEPARIQRRPALLIDIASTYAQQGDVEGACGHAIQALSIIAQTKSQTVAQRLLTLQQELEPWKDTYSVKNLDQQVALLFPSRKERGNA